MTLRVISKEIGQAWGLHRSKNNGNAVTQFEDIIDRLSKLDDDEDKNHHLVDAYYGLGLAERALGNRAKAKKAFETAFNIITKLAPSLGNHGVHTTSNTDAEEADRFIMLGAMIKQRLEEIPNE
jgi:tetratricopeptide (TPR) repeat protein